MPSAHSVEFLENGVYTVQTGGPAAHRFAELFVICLEGVASSTAIFPLLGSTVLDFNFKKRVLKSVVLLLLLPSFFFFFYFFLLHVLR